MVATKSTEAANPCAVKINPAKHVIVGSAIAVQLTAHPQPQPQPQIEAISIDAPHARANAFRQASEQVMALLSTIHTLTQDESTQISAFDAGHDDEQDRFNMRVDLLKQVLGQ
jgi:hypothetical protein